MSLEPLEYINIEPASEANSCVIWLHGLGDSGAGFAPVIPALQLPENHSIRFIFPHAPMQAVTVNGGYVMRSWYDIKGMDLHDRADMSGVLSSEGLVRELIEEQIAQGIKAQNIVLAGFSQGGLISLFTGLRFPQTLGGIMGLSCYLPGGEQLPQAVSHANRQTAILLQHGQQDEVVPLKAGEMARDALQGQDYSLKWQTYPMAHNVLPEQLQDIGQWLQQRLPQALN